MSNTPSGLPHCIKGRTLRRRAGVFFRHVSVEHSVPADKDLWLICSGMKIPHMHYATYAKRFTLGQYALLISDFLQADLEEFGLVVGKPIPNEYGGFTYLVCKR